MNQLAKTVIPTMQEHLVQPAQTLPHDDDNDIGTIPVIIADTNANQKTSANLPSSRHHHD